MREKTKLQELIKKADKYILHENVSGHDFKMGFDFEDSYDQDGHLVGQNCIIHQGKSHTLGIGENIGPYVSDWQGYSDMDIWVLDGWLRYYFEDGSEKLLLRDARIHIPGGTKFKWEIGRRMRCIFKFKNS
jgi:hypothetical protein